MCPVGLTDIVNISYTASTEDGEIIDKVLASDPVTVPIGSGKVLKAVEASLLGMEPGETRVVTIESEDAFGLHHKELVQKIDRAVFADKTDIKPGVVLLLKVKKDGQEQKVPATVTEIDDKTVTVDYNHPLAGKPITYTVTLHAIGN